jgi:predicted NUDIX family phosphoesterase
MKFLHRHLPISANLVKNVHKVLLDMRILSVSEKQGHRNMSISSYGHNREIGEKIEVQKKYLLMSCIASITTPSFP